MITMMESDRHKNTSVPALPCTVYTANKDFHCGVFANLHPLLEDPLEKLTLHE